MAIKNWNFNSLQDLIDTGSQLIAECTSPWEKVPRERFILGKFIRDWLRPEACDFPFVIEDHIETSDKHCPDCVLQFANQKMIGLELVEATLQSFRNDEVTLKNIPDNARWLHETDPVTYRTRVFHKEKISDTGEAELILHSKMKSGPLYSKPLETLAVRIIIESIEAKTLKYYSWDKYDSSELAILVNVPNINWFYLFNDTNLIVERLRTSLNETTQPKVFNQIYLIDTSRDKAQYHSSLQEVEGMYILRKR